MPVLAADMPSFRAHARPTLARLAWTDSMFLILLVTLTLAVAFIAHIHVVAVWIGG